MHFLDQRFLTDIKFCPLEFLTEIHIQYSFVFVDVECANMFCACSLTTQVPPVKCMFAHNIFWYFMHMRGKTICEFTVIIK